MKYLNRLFEIFLHLFCSLIKTLHVSKNMMLMIVMKLKYHRFRILYSFKLTHFLLVEPFDHSLHTNTLFQNLSQRGRHSTDNIYQQQSTTHNLLIELKSDSKLSITYMSRWQGKWCNYSVRIAWNFWYTGVTPIIATTVSWTKHRNLDIRLFKKNNMNLQLIVYVLFSATLVASQCTQGVSGMTLQFTI